MNLFTHFKELWQSLSLKKLKESGFWKKRKFWLGIGIFFMMLFTIATAYSAIYISKLDISKLQSPLAQPTYIYDKNGTKISELSSSRIEPVELENISEYMKNAVIAVEDRRFYSHPGVDVRSIFRALARDIKSGDFSEGGSTITQQLAKNLFLPSDKTINRKLKEVGYAIKIELTLSKDEILEAYLNNIYFGEGCWGVQEAARYYFGKTVDNVTLEEAAVIAGVIQTPSLTNPVNDKKRSLERRNVVLSQMKEQSLIRNEEYNTSLIAPINLRKEPLDDLSGNYAPYIDYVIEEAITKYGFTEDQILTGGLQIYTQLDTKIQDATETVYKDDHFFPEGKPDQIVQSGIAIIDQSTGAIRGLVGYRGKSAFRQFNHASQLKRQPGSVFKPISVYGPALEKGYRPDSMLYDGPLDIDGYQPRDWDYQTRGWVTMMNALQNSWNIPAVWLLNEIGIDSGLAFIGKAGIRLEDTGNTLSIALGGLANGVSPLDMAEAYSGFANGGTLHEAYAITKVTSKEGYVYVNAQPKTVKLIDSHNAYTMTLMLQNVVRNGTARNASMGYRPVAGKTGSVELPDTSEFSGITKGQKDVWFVGYTPELTAAVWIGYDKTDRDHYLLSAGGAEPAMIFREVLTKALADEPVKQFEVPAGYNFSWQLNLYPKSEEEEGEDEEVENDEEKDDNDKDKKDKKAKKDKKDKKKDPNSLIDGLLEQFGVGSDSKNSEEEEKNERKNKE